MARQTYHSRRRRNPWGRNSTLELVLTVVTVLAVIGVAALFMFVYHDLPFRLSGP
jgi:heme/copper-type cytochrome/quinol oxidase subunit 2